MPSTTGSSLSTLPFPSNTTAFRLEPPTTSNPPPVTTVLSLTIVPSAVTLSVSSSPMTRSFAALPEPDSWTANDTSSSGLSFERASTRNRAESARHVPRGTGVFVPPYEDVSAVNSYVLPPKANRSPSESDPSVQT